MIMMTQSAGSQSNNLRLRSSITIGIIFIVFALFGKSLGYGYVNIDDDRYIINNQVVQKGLTKDGLFWALKYQYGFWVPLTWVSYMAECQAGPPRGYRVGCRPWIHHATNVGLHAANAAILFILLFQLTSALWRSAIVAGIFAVHPLHVESVVWITERKDVLSTMLGLLSICAYLAYVRRNRQKWYWISIGIFVLSLMAKPMLVPMPLLLLLIDFWPLGRNFKMDLWKILKEKIPFIFVAGLFAILTTLAWRSGPEFSSLITTPLGIRVKSALGSYSWYLYKHFIPTNLAVHYPYRNKLPIGLASASLVIVFAITAVAVTHRKKFPYFAMGWLWFVITLTPVVGFLKYGGHSYADRFSYIPSIGLSIAVVWSVGELLPKLFDDASGESIVMALCIAPLIAFSYLTWKQIEVWKDSVSLFRNAVAVAPRDPLNHHNLGEALVYSGHIDEAIKQYELSLQIFPGRANTENSLGHAYDLLERKDEAVSHFTRAVELNPNLELAWANLAGIIAERGEALHASKLYERAIELNEDNPRTHFYLANMYRALNQIDKAIVHYERSLELEPNSAEAHNNLGLILMGQKRVNEAVTEFRAALKLSPMHAETNNNLGVALYSQGNKQEAILCFRRALLSNPEYPDAQRNLNVALEKQ